MASRDNINERILKEIDSLQTGKEYKEFLKRILAFELENIDRKPQYKDEYERIVNEVFF